jgi:hypothetical protein
MGVVPIVLVILAMKIPIFGLLWLVWWAGRGEKAEGPAEEPARDRRPLRPPPAPPGRPRRRGPHGGAAVLPAPRRSRGLTPRAAPGAVSSARGGSGARGR